LDIASEYERSHPEGNGNVQPLIPDLNVKGMID